MKILSIDVGIIHLGMVAAEVDDFDNYEIIKKEQIYFCDLINITQLFEKCGSKCDLIYHDKVTCDYMMHLFKLYKKEFESADIILVERQPLTGMVMIQDLILREYRAKTKLVSPTSMLKHFDILQYDYEHRKTLTVKIAEPFLYNFESFCLNERKHDMADAFCIIRYYLFIENKKYQKKIKKEQYSENFGRTVLDLQKYRYTPVNQ